MTRIALAALAVLAVHSTAFATWSVIAIDKKTGQVIVASATCVPQNAFVTGNMKAKGLMDIQAVIVPGKGVAACQAGVDVTRENQKLVFAELQKGTEPAQILEMLKQDPNIDRRQYGILDMEGRSAGFNGKNNGQSSLFVGGRVGTDMFYQVQGNILFSDQVMYEAALAFTRTKGTMADRVMAAMEAADNKGGDKRCTCESEPRPAMPCDGKTSHVAYIVIADKTDTNGSSYNDGSYFAYINVTNDNITAKENGNPVKTLRMRYDAWKKAGSKRTTSLN